MNLWYNNHRAPGGGGTKLRSDKMTNKKISIDIEGMTCAACSSRVENILNKNQGVNSAVVNLLANKATIEFNDDKVKEEDLVKLIEKAGFEVPLMKTSLMIEGMT